VAVFYASSPLGERGRVKESSHPAKASVAKLSAQISYNLNERNRGFANPSA